MSLFDTAQIQALSKFLDVTTARHKAVTNNIANVDTPGYKTKDVDFRRMLGSAGAGPEILRVNAQPKLREVDGLMERPDGNNVSLERESMLLAQSQLQFRTGVQLIRTEFRRLLSAINEGR
jgi:flagellar basal-body rod protein FlgB